MRIDLSFRSCHPKYVDGIYRDRDLLEVQTSSGSDIVNIFYIVRLGFISVCCLSACSCHWIVPIKMTLVTFVNCQMVLDVLSSVQAVSL